MIVKNAEDFSALLEALDRDEEAAKWVLDTGIGSIVKQVFESEPAEVLDVPPVGLFLTGLYVGYKMAERDEMERQFV